MGKQKDQVNDLLAAIKRQPITSSGGKPSAEIPEPAPEPKAPPIKRHSTKAASKVKAAQSRVGKPVQFWMHEPDRKLVRELSAWLAGQGVRPSDSMVIRAALRMAKTGGAFLEAYWEAAKLDGRLKRD